MCTTDIFDFLQQRRSIRKYKDKEVEPEKIERLLEAGVLAPSAGNSQPWRFKVIENQEIIEQLIEETMSAYNATWMSKGTPKLIAVCGNHTKIVDKYGERGKDLYIIQDTAAAIQNILLTAPTLGLGTCWIGAFNEKKAEEILNLNSPLRIYSFITVGYPKEKLGPRTSRKDLSEVVSYIK
ncbi:nitroreductase family protein [Natroniella sulfidigena]|uniref:nitroreductase family protein n=1 Tax=Natroniella sulfidigena TaxID=723921 RepID=UPI00200A3E73|nr:nitroreductase family protein [Natroniella sulfidigena]MCK8817474.1 nitroreductase family protein [Natroniella sulfidigena]